MYQIVNQTPANGESFESIYTGCVAALDAEIEAVIDGLKRWGGDTPVDVARAQIEGTEGEHTVYRFTIKRKLHPPEHTGVEVSCGTERVRGYVDAVEADGTELIIALERTLRNDPSLAIISFDATFVLRKMKERILQNPADWIAGRHQSLRVLGLAPVRIGKIQPTHSSLRSRELVDEQIDAVAVSAGSDLSLVFGPPGTGKTRTLGALVAELADAQNQRVLITAHTNTALDTAMASVLESLPRSWVSDAKIVRSGRLTREFDHLGIGYDEVAERAAAAMAESLKAEIDELEAKLNEALPAESAFFSLRSKLRKKSRKKGPVSIRGRITDLMARIGEQPSRIQARPEIQDLHDELDEIRAKLARAAAEIERNARVVGATLSKLSVEPQAFNDYDAVVIDEASMASLPQILIASLHAAGKIAVFGDPCQLSPIVVSQKDIATRYLGRNIYEQLGLEDPGIDDPRRPMLLTQFRMAPAIRQLVSEIFYAGRLRDAECVKEHAEIDGHNLILVDTSEMGVAAAKSGSSRVNEAHAEIVAEIARQIGEKGEGDVGIITPFAAQMKLIRQAVRGHHPAFFYSGGFVRTVHRAQGGEKNVIVLDTVDAPPAMSGFLDDSWNRDLRNLLCVALSRARVQLIVVAHTNGFRRKYGRRGALIMRILEEAYRRGQYLKPSRKAPEDENVLGGLAAQTLSSARG